MCEEFATRSMQLSDGLLRHADEIAAFCDHDGCLVLEGVLRDCALKIRRTANALSDELAQQKEPQSVGCSQEDEINCNREAKRFSTPEKGGNGPW
jgi:hypothetical protein